MSAVRESRIWWELPKLQSLQAVTTTLMEPTNDHERAIAKAVDDRLREDPDNQLHLILRDVVVSLDFAMSASDTQFLVRYVHWRGANPVGL